ncbi:MAG: pyruvate formate lyase-activating protein [Clostridia bacterium]|nr:MAG: pyruvate formate lyase-activating protein [Clostridia bacterium]
MVGEEVGGYLHSIETMGTLDNGGLRVVVFLSGCPMRCGFCHNPDTWLLRGRRVTVAQVLPEILPYQTYFRLSGGGVTVSGGEPLLQYKFVAALLAACGREHIHRALDTSGYCRRGHLEEILPHTDLVLFSLKVINPDKHRALTGCDNAAILANLRQVAASPVALKIRYVLLPTVNDSPADLQELAGVMAGLPRAVAVQILPYHRLGVKKWEELGWEYPLGNVPAASAEQVRQAAAFLREAGVAVQV